MKADERKMVLAQERELNERERLILDSIVRLYISRAVPIGSRQLSKYIQESVKLSPATIRNVMADLEEMEFITHPHTSAGRVPTDKGYRFYVDTISDINQLSKREWNAVRSHLKSDQSEQALKAASKVLGALSKYLAVVEIPNITELTVQRIELVPLSSTRLLIVIALDSKIVRTVTLEADFDIEHKFIDGITIYINEKVSGRPLNFLRQNFSEMMNDYSGDGSSVVRLIIDSVDKVFEYDSRAERLVKSGTQNLLNYPEFEDIQHVRSLMELIENDKLITEQLDKAHSSGYGIHVLIGREMQNDLLEGFSLIISTYCYGSAKGAVGLVGPKRMNYNKMISLVSSVSSVITEQR